ncbi:MAG TPA: hypothetical protein VMT62_14050, partial [Syntrophorhabdaceae bacterium]|nr:hypothetical protein [Syntrophorhabdaceae bacterium]
MRPNKRLKQHFSMVGRCVFLSVFTACFLCSIFAAQIQAACIEDATGAIICSGTDVNGVRTGDAADTITVQPGATVSETVQQTVVTTAAAGATTIDAGDGENTVTNAGEVTATAGATAQPSGISASQATATATAVKTGDNADTISNVSGIASTATSSATSPNISLTLSAATSSYNSTYSDATATGIDGGMGQNQITNAVAGSVTTSATSNSTAPVIGISVGDHARAYVSVRAESESTGMRGAGSVSNLGTLNVTATSGANTGAVQATISGSAIADASTGADASATGIAGSASSDTINSEGKITVAATATAEGSLDLEGSATNVAIDASIHAGATAKGIDGNGGNDSITNSSTLTVNATASVTNDSSGSSYWAPGMTNASTSSTALTTGIAGGDGTDTITNNGTITASALATTEVSNVLTSYGIEKAVATQANGGASSSATVFGIDGRGGTDTITNNGTINASATATTSSAGVLLTYFGLGMFSIPTTATAESTGIEGGAGSDTITNAGTLSATSTATASTTGVSVSGLQYDVLSDGNSSISATATATGISGGAGDDTISNAGSVTVTASPTASTTRVGVEAVGSSRLDADTRATATAVGIADGAGDDHITNESGGLITVNANPTATATGVDVRMIGVPTVAYEFFAQKDLESARTVTQAAATGIDGGAGNDTITNNGTVLVGASADTDSETWSVTITPPLGAVSGIAASSSIATSAGVLAAEGGGSQSTSSGTDSLIKAGTGAYAVTAGITGGDGADTITNNGSITSGATADAYSVGVTLSLGFGKGGVMSILPSVALINTATTADAAATGIDGGTGDDHIYQNNTMNVTSNAYATSASIGIDFKGSWGPGFAWGGTISDSSTTATSQSTGIAGGDGDDTITNSGAHGITVVSGADADSTSVSATVMWANQGVAGGITYLEDSTTAQASAVGIDGGLGRDTITNSAGLTVSATAEATSAAVSISAAGTETGVSLDGALTKAALTATSSATGIDGGVGNDTITNTATMAVSSSADVDSAGVSVGLGFSKTGVVAGVAAADVGVTATSTAVGLAGGAGDDTVTNSGTMTTTASSTISAAGVSVQAGYAVNGVAAGGALVKGKSVAEALATGIDGGTGDDTLTNWGNNTVTATSTVTAASVGVNLEGTSAGLAAGASVVDGNNTVDSRATGLAGGAGNDKIYNYNQTTVSATTDSTRTNFSVTGTFSLEGMSAGAAFANASNTATATGTGIDGGDGDDTIINNGILKTDATTTATTNSVSIDVNISAEGVSAGASVAKASSSSTAYATGLAGGAGDDTIENQSSGVISGTAHATAKVTSVSVDISDVSFSKADVTTTVEARYTGMDGGAGNDTMSNLGSINVNSVSTATGNSGTGSITGYGSADVSVTGTSISTGMDGGDGDDKIYNWNAINAASTATSDGVSVAVNLLGAGFANASTTANAYATGLAGGAGTDTLENHGLITLTATSDVNQTGVSVRLGGYSDSDGSNTSQATITGMDGGAGDDTMTNYTGATITGTATAKAEAVSVPIALLGASNADGTTQAVATAYGMAGGSGNDTMHNYGTITITANSTPTGKSGGGTVGGYGEADVGITATAITVGMDGGEGDDKIYNWNAINATSTATAKGLSVTVDLLGAGFANASTTANTTATGLAGGAGTDTLENHGLITLTATSDVDQTGVAVVLGGYSDSDGSNTSQATITGMDGGAGDDTMTNYTGATITGTATAKGEVVNVPVALLGDSNADGTTTARAAAYGMTGGAGNDTMYNYGTIIITANSTPTGKSGGGTIGGYGEADASVTGASTTVGMDGGEGDDKIYNWGSINLTSTATSKGVPVTVDLLGAGFANASTTANTTATGLAGGAGNDTLENHGSITLTATSDVDQTGVAVVLGGYSDSDGSNTSQATITGMDGGAGDDTMTNYTGATITGTATAQAEMISVPVALLGDANADGTTRAIATAYGMAGGSGNDTMHNYGTITITANSTPTGQSGSGTLAGYGEADVGITATAITVGMDGGAGDDKIYNWNAINATSTATANGLSVTVEMLGGAGYANASTTANTTSTGMAGGAGNDTLENHGLIHLTATSDVDDTGVSVTLAGYASSNGANTATATLIGMDGGAGDDTMTNYANGTIKIVDNETTLDPTASVHMSSTTIELAGDQRADGGAVATAIAYGMAGGAGNDIIQNAGAITVNISSAIYASATSASLFGKGVSNTSGSSNTTVVGMDASDGDNTVTNFSTGVMTLTATATGQAGGYTLMLGGDADATAGTSATASAYGMRAGGGADYLYNYGTIGVTAASTLTDSSSSYTLFGTGTTSSNDTASSLAVGMDGGDGINTILNGSGAHLTVSATASPSADNGSETFGGTAEADANSTATATAKGIIGGAARDVITNDGNLDIDAYANAKAITNAALFAGRATAYSTTAMTALAVGIDAGEGQNTVTNNKSISVDATTEVSCYSKADTDLDRTNSNAQSSSDVSAFGIHNGNGDSTITNGQGGTIIVHSIARSLSFAVDGEGAPVERTTAVSDEVANASAIFASSATGMHAGDGNNTITNLGTLTVTAETTPDSHALASSMEYTATATAIAGGHADAMGIRAGNGNNTIANNGPLTVTATNTGTALADYTSTHLDHAIAYAGAGDVSLTSTATGISVGNGFNTIASRGDITVTSTLTSNAHGHSNTDFADNRGDAYAGGIATATGISAGDGQNTISNYGNMTVTASASVFAYGDGEDYATAQASSQAHARGIITGNGNNTVTNYGTITVTGVTSSMAAVSVGSDATATERRSAVGIETGSGNDLVTNYGTIETKQTQKTWFFDISSPGIAISTGAGNDTVVLGAGSVTTGAIDLGSGDNTLEFLGTATVNGDILPGPGNNTLVFDGTGTLGYDFSGFENTIKQGAGTFTLASLPTMNSLTIKQGTLQVNNSYAMANNSSFSTYLYGNNGGAGLLSVKGTASLAGALTVVKGPGYFYNGSLYNIVTGTSVTGAFSGVTLPQATPMLSFTMVKTPSALQVEALARSFTLFAGDPTGQAIADYLNRIQHTNSSDLLGVLAQMQNLPASQFNQAFLSLSPQSYGISTRASYTGSWQNTGSLQRR